jgi:hypothetical protein
MTAVMVGVGGITWAGCDSGDSSNNPQTNTAAEQRTDAAAQRTENAADRTGDAAARTAKNAGETIGNAVQTAGSAIGNAAEKSGAAINDAAQTAGEKVNGATANGAGGIEGIPSVIGEAAEAALTDDGLDDLVERFVDADRNRIGKAELGGDANQPLDNLVKQVRDTWKQKYNAEFDIGDARALLGADFATVRAGELGAGAAGTDVDVDVKRTGVAGEPAKVNVDVDHKSGVDAPDSKAADANRNDPGRNVAVANIKASHGLPDLQVPMIHEAGGWKIDVPNNVDGPKLRANLIAHLTAAKDSAAQLPANADEAKRALTHHVLMAVMDKPVVK